VVAIFGVINRVPASTHARNVFCYSAVAHILTPSVNLAFRPESAFKNKCRARARFGLVISGSGRVQTSKWGPFTDLCGQWRNWRFEPGGTARSWREPIGHCRGAHKPTHWKI